MKQVIIGLLLILLCTVGAVSAVDQSDRLNKAFDRSHEAMADPYSSDLEADDLFETTNANGVGGGGFYSGQSDSVFVRFTRFMLRLVAILAVPMILYAAIRVMLAFGDSGKLKEALKLLGQILLGILLALSSVMIIYLIYGLTRSSINFFS